MKYKIILCSICTLCLLVSISYIFYIPKSTINDENIIIIDSNIYFAENNSIYMQKNNRIYKTINMKYSNLKILKYNDNLICYSKESSDLLIMDKNLENLSILYSYETIIADVFVYNNEIYVGTSLGIYLKDVIIVNKPCEELNINNNVITFKSISLKSFEERLDALDVFGNIKNIRNFRNDSYFDKYTTLCTFGLETKSFEEYEYHSKKILLDGYYIGSDNNIYLDNNIVLEEKTKDAIKYKQNIYYIKVNDKNIYKLNLHTNNIKILKTNGEVQFFNIDKYGQVYFKNNTSTKIKSKIML